MRHSIVIVSGMAALIAVVLFSFLIITESANPKVDELNSKKPTKVRTATEEPANQRIPHVSIKQASFRIHRIDSQPVTGIRVIHIAADGHYLELHPGPGEIYRGDVGLHVVFAHDCIPRLFLLKDSDESRAITIHGSARVDLGGLISDEEATLLPAKSVSRRDPDYDVVIEATDSATRLIYHLQRDRSKTHSARSKLNTLSIDRLVKYLQSKKEDAAVFQFAFTKKVAPGQWIRVPTQSCMTLCLTSDRDVKLHLGPKRYPLTRKEKTWLAEGISFANSRERMQIIPNSNRLLSGTLRGRLRLPDGFRPVGDFSARVSRNEITYARGSRVAFLPVIARKQFSGIGFEIKGILPGKHCIAIRGQNADRDEICVMKAFEMKSSESHDLGVLSAESETTIEILSEPVKPGGWDLRIFSHDGSQFRSRHGHISFSIHVPESGRKRIWGLPARGRFIFQIDGGVLNGYRVKSLKRAVVLQVINRIRLEPRVQKLIRAQLEVTDPGGSKRFKKWTLIDTSQNRAVSFKGKQPQWRNGSWKCQLDLGRGSYVLLGLPQLDSDLGVGMLVFSTTSGDIRASGSVAQGRSIGGKLPHLIKTPVAWIVVNAYAVRIKSTPAESGTFTFRGLPAGIPLELQALSKTGGVLARMKIPTTGQAGSMVLTESDWK